MARKANGVSALLATLVCAALLAQLGHAHRKAVRCLNRREACWPDPLTSYPSVTVVRPVKGTDVEQGANFRAALDTGYPGEIETVFVIEDEADPSCPLIREAINRHVESGTHGTARILYSGAPPPGCTGKIHNMIAGEASAVGDIIVFGDSDTRPDTAVLKNVVEHLMTDDTGAAFAPVVNPCPARSSGDVGYAIILNAYLTAGMEAELGPRRHFPFLMGQMMAFRRTALRDIGGVRCAEGQLVDDMYLGARIVEAGYRNVMGTHRLNVINHGLGFGGFIKLWRRWLFCGRGGIPFSFVRPFVVRAVSYFVSLGLAFALLVSGPAWLAFLPLLLWILEGLHYIRLHRLVGGAAIPLRFLWMAWMPFPTAIPIGLSMLVKPELDWRGHTYRLDAAGRLSSSGSSFPTDAGSSSGDPK